MLSDTEEMVGATMEERLSMKNNAREKFEKALAFMKEPGRKVMALGMARSSKLIYLQLGEGFEDRLKEVSELVDQLEREVVLEKAAVAKKERQDLEEAAVQWGTATAADAAEENVTRLQVGIWLAFEKHMQLNIWDGAGRAERRKMDPKLWAKVERLLQNIERVPGVGSAAAGDVNKLFDSNHAWVVNIKIVAKWGKKTYRIAF